MKYHMTCKEFIDLLATDQRQTVTDVCDPDSGYEFELNYYADRDGDMWVITDSDTDDQIIIKDPENMNIEY